MADIQLMQCKNQQKTSSNRGNIVPYKDTAHAQWLQTHLVTLSFGLNQVLNLVLNQGTGYGSVQMTPCYCPKY